MVDVGAEFWTDTTRANLAEMIGQGLAYGECGRALGCPRNLAAAEGARLVAAGVIAQPEPAPTVVFRPAAAPKPPKAAKPPKALTPPQEPKAPRPVKAAAPKPAKPERPVVPVLTHKEISARVGEVAGSVPKPWLERARVGECAWPVKGVGADVWSCCGPTTGNRRYCDPHFEVMYQKAPKVPYVQRPRGGSERQFRA